MAAYTTLDLLTAVRARGMLPDASTGSLSADNLLIYATRELYTKLVPMILAVREKYFETYTDTALIAAQGAYPIPERAIGGVLSSLQYITDLIIYPLEPMDPVGITTVGSSLTPRGFYFQHNSVVLYPTPESATGSIRMRYFQRPNALSQTSACAQVSSFSALTNEVVVSSIPSTWVTGTVVDFIPGTLPFTPYSKDTSITGVTGTTISFTALPSTIANGDWLALSQTTPVPEIPVEFQQILEQMTLVKALQGVGDKEGFAIAKGELEDARSDVIKLITPRDQYGCKKVVSNWRSW